MAEEAGVAFPTGPKTSGFFIALDCCLVPLVTSKWLEDAPRFLEPGVLDAARTLCSGETLCNKYPWVWPNHFAAGIAGPAPIFAHPVAPSPVTAGPIASSPGSSSRPSRLSPLVLPTALRTPSSNSGVPSPMSGGASPLVSSPLALPAPSMESAPCRGRSVAHSSYQQPAEGTPAVVPSSVPVPGSQPAGSSSAAPRTSKKRPLDDVEMATCSPGKQWKSCQRCSSKKQRCTPPADANPPYNYPCAFCKKEKVLCLPPSPASGAYPFILLSGRLAWFSWFVTSPGASDPSDLGHMRSDFIQAGQVICPAHVLEHCGDSRQGGRVRDQNPFLSNRQCISNQSPGHSDAWFHPHVRGESHLLELRALELLA